MDVSSFYNNRKHQILCCLWGTPLKDCFNYVVAMEKANESAAGNSNNTMTLPMRCGKPVGAQAAHMIIFNDHKCCKEGDGKCDSPSAHTVPFFEILVSIKIISAAVDRQTLYVGISKTEA